MGAMTVRMSMLALALTTACAPLPAPVFVAPLGASCTHAAAVGGEVPPTVGPPYEAQRLTNAVAELAPETVDAGRLVVALLRLADAVAIAAPERTADIDEIRTSADELRGSHRPKVHSQVVKAGLDAALRALTASPPFYTFDLERYRHAVTMLATALAAVDPETPLASQPGRIAAAFREATRTIYVAVGARTPFEPAAIANADHR